MFENAARNCVILLTAIVAATLLSGCPVLAQPSAGAPGPTVFPIAPHSDVDIEWWYLYAHLTTRSGRRLAMVTSFFRIGHAKAAATDGGSIAKSLPQSHYLIYAVTDIAAQTHSAFSLADRNSLKLIQQIATLEVLRNPGDLEAQKLLALAAKSRFPPPTKLISGTCRVSNAPEFSAVYGDAASLRAVPGRVNAYRLIIGDGKGSELHLDLTFSGAKPPMYVGGDGNTGIARPDDMKYVSLTRCDVTGTIDTGAGPEAVASAQGWFDHQWGDSWTTASVGWDWWGIQLADGRDILLYRMRRMDTGAIFSPMATIEDSSGKLTVARNITFFPDPASIWQSPTTRIRYPLRWTVDIGNLELKISPDVQDQEIPVLASGGAIWEGSVTVKAVDAARGADGSVSGSRPVINTGGVGYMELVGYGAGAATPKPAGPEVSGQEHAPGRSRSGGTKAGWAELTL